MKKRLTFITILMLFCSTMFGQSHWEMTEQEIDKYQNSQTICISVLIDGVPQNVENLEIAAFHNNELRGVGVTTLFTPKQTYVATIKVYGTTPDEEISLKLYDSRSEKELSSDYKFDWNPDENGTPLNPISVNFYEKHWDSNENYQNTMSIACTIKINGEIQKRTDLELAAFCGNDLRGATRVEKLEGGDLYIAILYIGGTDGETINFKLYDPTIDMELTTDYAVPFQTNATMGDDEEIIMEFNAPVAQLGTEKFMTLAEAVAVAQPNETIKLINNAKGNGIVINKSLTIDFGGFTYTFTSPAVGSTGTQTLGFQILKDNTVTLQNGTLNVAEAARTDFAMLIQNYADLTITDMTLNGDNLDRYTIKDYDYSYVLSNNSGEVYIGGNTQILANPGAVEGDGHYGVAFDVCKYANYTAPVVTLGEDVTVQGKVEVTGGQLYTNAALNAVVKKTIEGSTKGWGTLSSPTAEGIAAFSTSTGHDFYQYVESAEKEWNNIGGDFNSYTMTVGRGYLYANKTTTEVSFEGTLNHQDVNYTLSYTPKDLAGFNFIGNPFTHNITAAHLSGNKTEGYYVVGEDGTFQVRNTTEETIAPMQAVLVQATEAGNLTNLTIKKTARATQTREASNGALEIVVANTDYSDVAYVSFNDGIGLEKIGHQNANAPLVYVTAESKKFAIATMKQDVNEIPVSFVAKTMGQYTISVEAVDCEFNEMYLTDRMTGEKVNLLLEDYTFVATSNDNADRFIISFGTTKPESVAENFIYINNGNMIINNIEGNAVVRVLDVLGRPVAEYNVTESANISTATLSSGVYMIQMYDNNGVKVQKIVVE